MKLYERKKTFKSLIKTYYLNIYAMGLIESNGLDVFDLGDICPA